MATIQEILDKINASKSNNINNNSFIDLMRQISGNPEDAIAPVNDTNSIYGHIVQMYTALYDSGVDYALLIASVEAIQGVFERSNVIESLYADKTKLDSIYADKIKLDQLFADKAVIDRVYGSITNIDRVHTSIDKLDTVYASVLKMDTVADNIADVNIVADSMTVLNEIYDNRVEIYASDDNAVIATTKASEASTSAASAVTSASTATAKASAASVSATSASNSATTATTKASESLNSANSASTSATTATNKAAEAISSASTASTAASSALTSAATATTKASEASASVTASASNASAALTSKNAAAASEASALTYKNSASTSATTATTKASAASASAAAALVSETNANTSKNTAATSATTATTKASEASTSASNASTSATNASTSASAASVSASTSATKATEAATSASTALGYKNDVSTMKLAIETIYDTFDDRFLGTKTTNPLVDNDGNALLDGALYFDTTTNAMKVYDVGTTTWYSMPQIYLNSLLDVELTSLTTGNILVWNGTKWINYTLSKADVGLNLVDNTADSAKNVLSATKLKTARTINGVAFDGSANITIATADSTKLPLSGGVMTGAITSIRETRVAVDSNSINLAAGNVFTKTISANVSLVVANIASSGTTNSFILELTNGGAYIVTWWSGVKWTGGIAPILSVAGTDILGFYSHDGGLSWHGILVSKDSK